MRLARLLILMLAAGVIARAQPAPLAVDAYAVQRGGDATLVIGVFVATPAQVAVRVALPAGWSGAPIAWTGVVSGVLQLVYPLQVAADAPPGLGTILVQASADGAYASDRAWVRAPGEVAARPGVRARLAVVRR